MRLLHDLAKIHATFDDPNLVSRAGLVPVMALAQRAGLTGVQEWLSFYFKSPQHAPSAYPEHDLFVQHAKLENTLRWMMGEEQG